MVKDFGCKAIKAVLGLAVLILVVPIQAAIANDGCENVFAAVTTDWIEQQLVHADARDPVRKQSDSNAQILGVLNSSINLEIVRAHNEDYTRIVPTGVQTNQESSGRCWMYAGLNLIRAKAIFARVVPEDFEFSANYLYFFNFLEQANMGLEQGLKAMSTSRGTKLKQSVRDAIDNVSDGGYFHQFEFLIAKYGLQPKEAMPETEASKNPNPLIEELHRVMAAGLNRVMEKSAGKTGAKGNERLSAEERDAARKEILQQVVDVLVTYLGRPKTEFDYVVNQEATPDQKSGTFGVTTESKKMTSKDFAASVIRFDPNDFVLVAANDGFKQGKTYMLEDARFAISGDGTQDRGFRYLNLTPERMQELTEASLTAGIPVYFAAEMDSAAMGPKGILHPDVHRPHLVHGQADTTSTGLPRSKRAFFLGAWANHAMLIRAMDKPDPTKPAKKFMVENSWGDEAGDNGKFHLYREFMHENVHLVVVPRSVLSEAEQMAWAMRPTMITEQQLRLAEPAPRNSSEAR